MFQCWCRPEIPRGQIIWRAASGPVPGRDTGRIQNKFRHRHASLSARHLLGAGKDQTTLDGAYRSPMSSMAVARKGMHNPDVIIDPLVRGQPPCGCPLDTQDSTENASLEAGKTRIRLPHMTDLDYYYSPSLCCFIVSVYTREEKTS